MAAAVQRSGIAISRCHAARMRDYHRREADHANQFSLRCHAIAGGKLSAHQPDTEQRHHHERIQHPLDSHAGERGGERHWREAIDRGYTEELASAQRQHVVGGEADGNGIPQRSARDRRTIILPEQQSPAWYAQGKRHGSEYNCDAHRQHARRADDRPDVGKRLVPKSPPHQCRGDDNAQANLQRTRAATFQAASRANGTRSRSSWMYGRNWSTDVAGSASRSRIRWRSSSARENAAGPR